MCMCVCVRVCVYITSSSVYVKRFYIAWRGGDRVGYSRTCNEIKTSILSKDDDLFEYSNVDSYVESRELRIINKIYT